MLYATMMMMKNMSIHTRAGLVVVFVLVPHKYNQIFSRKICRHVATHEIFLFFILISTNTSMGTMSMFVAASLTHSTEYSLL